MKKKEFGGFIPLDLDLKREYYSGKNVVSLDKARSGFVYSIWDKGNVERLYMPYYICPKVADFIEFYTRIEISFYNLNEKMEPPELDLKKNEMMLVVNYFGLLNGVVERLAEKYGESLIIDNTQAFYFTPFGKSYFVYSCRKFFGVNDGAYLCHDGLKKITIKASSLSFSINSLVSQYHLGINQLYDEYKDNEAILDNTPVEEMSEITKTLLKCVNYTHVSQIRKRNYQRINKKLETYNEFEVSIVSSDFTPQVYPFLCRKPGLREYLIENLIYVPRWWKHVLENTMTTSWEKELAMYLFPIPVDQRYSESDMDYISEAILRYILDDGL